MLHCVVISGVLLLIVPRRVSNDVYIAGVVFVAGVTIVPLLGEVWLLQ